jgi:hypothetical protein
MPNRETVRQWLAKDSKFLGQYARAREDQADALAEEALEAARSADKETAIAARVHMDAIRWFAGKVHPKKYGERQTHEVELGANDRLLALIEQGMTRAGSR